MVCKCSRHTPNYGHPGYSELLAGIPALSPQDRDTAKAIHQQVHHAQAAVISLHDTLRRPSPRPPVMADKPSAT